MGDDLSQDEGDHQLIRYRGTLALILCALLLGDGRAASAAQVSNPASPTQSTSLAAGIIPGYLSGCTLSNNGLQALDVAACNARDSGDAVSMSTTAATTAKALQTAWAVGSSAGCLDTGTIAASTWYHVHAIQRTDTSVTDFLCSLSATAPTLPTNYTKSRRLGSVLTNGSSNIVSFTQDGDYFVWSASVLDTDATNPGTAAVTRTLTVPTGVNVQAIVTLFANANTGAYLSDLAATDEAPSVSLAPLFHTTTAAAGAGQVVMRTNTSGQIRSRVSNSGGGEIIRIATHGWIDRRGK